MNHGDPEPCSDKVPSSDNVMERTVCEFKTAVLDTTRIALLILFLLGLPSGQLLFAGDDTPKVVFLGIAQDGGFPQAGVPA